MLPLASICWLALSIGIVSSLKRGSHWHQGRSKDDTILNLTDRLQRADFGNRRCESFSMHADSEELPQMTHTRPAKAGASAKCRGGSARLEHIPKIHPTDAPTRDFSSAAILFLRCALESWRPRTQNSAPICARSSLAAISALKSDMFRPSLNKP
jgi:hypothetical protein